jgi:hypothetical protein
MNATFIDFVSIALRTKKYETRKSGRSPDKSASDISETYERSLKKTITIMQIKKKTITVQRFLSDPKWTGGNCILKPTTTVRIGVHRSLSQNKI